MRRRMGLLRPTAAALRPAAMHPAAVALAAAEPTRRHGRARQLMWPPSRRIRRRIPCRRRPPSLVNSSPQSARMVRRVASVCAH